MNWLQKIAQSISPILAGLAAEAQKYATPEEFEKAFIHDIKHGMYWHLTDNSDFFIDPELGPRDMSSMSMNNDNLDKGKLMVTSHLEHWALEYAPHRPYAALIDMSLVPSNEYQQVNRGFGNEFFVSDPSKAKVLGVFDIKDALRIDYEHSSSLPQNSAELRNFWNQAKETEVPNFSFREFLSFSQHLPAEQWERQWQEDWKHEWE